MTVPTFGDEQSAAPNTPTTSAPMATPAVPTPTQSPTHVHESPPASPPPQLRRSARVRKPSRIVRDLQAGEGTAPTRGLQFPNPPTEDVEEAGGVWAVVDGTPELLEDFEGLENVFAAETADTEAMEPRTLAEAKRRPDWLQWERRSKKNWVFKAKKRTPRETSPVSLVAQGLSQIGGVDYDDTYAPAACLASSRTVIAMANYLRLEL
jgi:hypothetical protein